MTLLTTPSRSTYLALSGANPVPQSALPWTGDFLDGLGNKISVKAYANPDDIKDERKRSDGYGVVRFDKKSRRITFECWPRFAKLDAGDKGQFPGWPITINMADNDGRKPVAWLSELVFEGATDPVVQVIDEQSREVLYTQRVPGERFRPPVFATGTYTVKIGRDKPDGQTISGVVAQTTEPNKVQVVKF